MNLENIVPFQPDTYGGYCWRQNVSAVIFFLQVTLGELPFIVITFEDEFVALFCLKDCEIRCNTSKHQLKWQKSKL